MHASRKFLHLLVVAGLLFCGQAPLARAGQPTPTPQGQAATTAPDYANLSQLTAAIGHDAIGRFTGFFAPTSVTVVPFVTMDDPIHRPSLLGIVLADEMVAMVNNETGNRFTGKPTATGRQELTGVLQEFDGYLRIHISGRNAWGAQRSYVVAVEMSAPLYRALHSYPAP